MAKVDYATSAAQIVELVGGTGNISKVTHCVTRVRFVLKDETVAHDNTEAVKKVPGVIQVVIGTAVAKMYDEVVAITGNAGGEVAADEGQDDTEGEEDTAMRIRQIRNATLVIDYAGSRLLVDPWLEDAGTGMLARSPWPERNEQRSPLVELPCPAEEVLAGVDAAVVTHVHPDHFEEKTAALMVHALPVYAQNETDAATIASWGFTDVRVLSDAGSPFGSLTLTRVPAQHGLTPETDCGPQAVWSSRPLTSPRST